MNGRAHWISIPFVQLITDGNTSASQQHFLLRFILSNSLNHICCTFTITTAATEVDRPKSNYKRKTSNFLVESIPRIAGNIHRIVERLQADSIRKMKQYAKPLADIRVSEQRNTVVHSAVVKCNWMIWKRSLSVRQQEYLLGCWWNAHGKKMAITGYGCAGVRM